METEAGISHMKRDSIKIGYPGSCCSVNHYLGRRKGGGYYVKEETKAFKTELQWLLKCCHLEDYKLPLEVTCSGYFQDERSAPDLSNLSKVILDSIQELIGGNDKDYRWHDGDRIVGVKELAYLLITLKESGNTPELAPDALRLKSRRVKGESNTIPQPKRKYTRKIK